MSARRAACDPCISSKVACDHKQPVCTRCSRSRKALTCKYRVSPFKRRKLESAVAPAAITTWNTRPRDTSPSEVSLVRNSHLNPGHLGTSSHVAIFDQIQLDRTSTSPPRVSHTPPMQSIYTPSHELDSALHQAAEMLKSVLDSYDLASMQELVNFWLAKGVNLALAEPLLIYCVAAMNHIRSTMHHDGWHLILSRTLLENSSRSLAYTETSTLSAFTEQFCDVNIRWETLGLFLIAIVRATFDVSFFPLLYTTESRRQQLRESATRLSTCVLQICLSLDHLNDLQFVFHYEAFIITTYVNGDHSLRSWRSLGDVIASALALGYHENAHKPGVPSFLVELRKTALARIYSADKNVAIFLGRPPRMSKRTSCFQVPSCRRASGSNLSVQEDDYAIAEWHSDSEICYRAESRWSALCASIKEDILEIMLGMDRSHAAHEASEITTRIELQYKNLPASFRLKSSLKKCTAKTPFERDFLVSTSLNHLHVQFLLRLALLDHLADPDPQILEVSQQILALVVEAILLRDNLANSGTGLIWKIAYYGLPAAGIILLAQLKHRKAQKNPTSSQFQIWQDLSILAASVQRGSIGWLGEPLYPLLLKATQTIQAFLESIDSHEELQGSEKTAEEPEALDIDNLFPLPSPDPWNLEISFWENLAEHPFLSNTDPFSEDP